MTIRRGEIYWVNIPRAHAVGSEHCYRHPYIVVSRNEINNAGKTVVGVPMTSKTNKANSHRILIPVSMIIKDVLCTDTLVDSVALTDHIRVLDKSRLETPKIGKLSETATIAVVEVGLAFLFDIPD